MQGERINSQPTFSTAKSINMRQVGDLITAFCVADVVAFFLALFAGLFCFEGRYFDFALPFSVHPEGAVLNSWNIFSLQRVFTAADPSSLSTAVRTLSYSFTAPNAQVITVPVGQYLQLLFWLFAVLVLFEILICWRKLILGPHKVREELSGLNNIAITTQVLTQLPSKYHDLERAIEHMDPASLGSRLHTGDEDLASLENAINGLLQRQQDAARQQVRFVSDVSHELRTPIAVIQGYARMLDRWGKEDEQVLDEGITAIKNEAARMNVLVEQLLFLARSDSGETPLQVDNIALANLMQEVHDEFEMIDTSHNYTFTANAFPQVLGDVALVKQVARVLTENAGKYTPAGGNIDLSVGLTDEGLPYLQVQDDGAGIEEGDLPNIFQRFYRADAARERKTGGSGLGLSIASWIVQRHGGHFDVYSRPGVGTRMRVVLPIENEYF